MTSNYPIPRSRHFQSRVTKGKELLPGVDGRTRWARRLHDLCANHVMDLGGPNHVTQSQFALIRSAATQTIILEKWELRFAQEDAAGGTIDLGNILAYQTVVNSLRRVLETLGLNRVDPPPDARSPLDMSKLTEAEKQRYSTLSYTASEVGLEGMSEVQKKELYQLMAKAAGRGVGPSATDITIRERPYHEIDWSRT
jgi:hypothetical protein